MAEIVFVRWYREILQGEVVENDRQDQLAGMVAVRIQIQGVFVTALFTPGHVYQSKDEAEIKGNSPIISSNSPKVDTEEREISRTDPEISKSEAIISSNSPKVDTEEREISRTDPEISKSEAIISRTDPEISKSEAIISDIETNDPGVASSDGWKILQQFKTEHWDHERNHLRIDALDEFYRLWLKTHDHRDSKTETITEIAPQSHTQKPQPPVKHKQKMRCWHCEYLDNDLLSGCHESVADGCHFCGLHGRAQVDPDGPQQNLDHKGGCGYVQRKHPVQLDLFS